MKKLLLLPLFLYSTLYASTSSDPDIVMAGGTLLYRPELSVDASQFISLNKIDTSPGENDTILSQSKTQEEALTSQMVWQDTIITCEKYEPEPKHKKGELLFFTPKCLKKKKVTSSGYTNPENSIILGTECKVYATPENNIYVYCNDGTRVSISSLSLTYQASRENYRGS